MKDLLSRQIVGGYTVVINNSIGEYVLKKLPRSNKRRIVKKWFKKFKVWQSSIIIDNSKMIIYCSSSEYQQLKAKY
jgi:hypothetical protein